MEIGFEVAGFAVERFGGAEAVFDLLALLENSLRLLLILPEIRVADFFFEGGELLAGGFYVKDSSARGRCAS
jgi:hypothetical protein